MAGYAYEYDPTASNAANEIGGETHPISNYRNAYRCIIPLHAPFFREAVAIYHLSSGGVKTRLHEGIDFYFGHYYNEAADATKMTIYGSIMLIEPMTGSIVFDYHTLGGPYSVDNDEIQKYLAKVDLPDPRNVDWVDVMTYPRTVPTTTMPSTMAEALAADRVLAELAKVRDKMLVIAEAEKVAYRAIFQALDALSDKVTAYKLINHPHTRSQHAVTYAQLGALAKDATAVNALKAYGRTVTELVTYLASIGVTDAQLNEYYKLIGDVFTGRLSFTDNTACLLQNNGGLTVVSLDNGSIKLLSTSNAGLYADTDANSAGVSSSMRAGKNKLSVHSDEMTLGTSAVYNGHYLIHAGNIAEYMEAAGAATRPALELKTADTATVKLYGNGKASDALYGTVSFVQGDTTKAGILKLASSITSNDPATAATAAMLKSALFKINSYVAKTTTVNGKALSGNITLSKNDLALGWVDNTAPANKPVSDDFAEAITHKALKHHTHPDALADLPLGTATKAGYVLLSADTASFSWGNTTTAATGYHHKYLKNELKKVEDVVPSKVEKDIVCIQKLYSVSGVNPITVSGFNITVANDVYLYVEGVAVKVNPGVFTMTPGTTRWLVAAVAGNQASCSLQSAYPTSGWVLGKFTASGAGVTAATLGEYVAFDIEGVTETTLVELRNHIADKTAHGTAGGLTERLGLEDVENKAAVSTIVVPTFSDVFNNWKRISHAGSNTFPANASELSAWVYDSANDVIKCTQNTNTWVGFVSPDTFADYTFETKLSSTDGDDDAIGVIIGFVTDSNGIEHALVAYRTLDGSSSPKKGYTFAVEYNPGRTAAGYAVQVIERAGGSVNYGWNTAGTCRIRVVRKGTKFTVYFYGLTGVAAEGDVLVHTTEFDTANYSFASLFSGPTKVGYLAQSQNQSSYKNIIRPDEDGRSYYAKANTLAELETSMAGEVKILRGSVVHGATIPIPAGFSSAECHAIVYPPMPDAAASVKASGILSFEYGVAANKTVTAKRLIKASAGEEAVWTYDTVTYYLIAIKKNSAIL